MADAYPRFTVAAVQAASVFPDRDKTVDKAVRFIEEAGDKGAVIIGFPELFIPGEPNVWYMCKKTNPLRSHGRMFKEYVRNAVTIPSPATDRLCAAARKAHAYVVIGIVEQDPVYIGTLYISQLFISDTGDILGVHRKMVTTDIEKLLFACGDGSYLNVYDTPYGKLSAMNCGEHAHSLFKYALLGMGTKIHVAGWVSFPDKAFNQTQRNSIDFRVRQFAHEGKIFVINSCGITDRQNIDCCCDTQEEKDDIMENTGGCSSIIAPNGDYLAGPVYEGECILTADISLEDTFPGKQLHDVLGHYSRWDIFSLNFNRERLSPFIKTPQTQPTTTVSSELDDIRQEIRNLKEKLTSAENKAEFRDKSN